MQETLIDRAAKAAKSLYGLNKQDWIRLLVLKEAERLAPPEPTVDEVTDAPAPAEAASELTEVATPPAEVIPREVSAPTLSVPAPVPPGTETAPCGCTRFNGAVTLCPEHLREMQARPVGFPTLVIPPVNGQPEQH